MPYVSSHRNSESARTVDSEGEIGNNISDDEKRCNNQGNSNSSSVKDFNQIQPPVSSELSDEDLEHLRVKSKDTIKDEVDTPEEKINPGEEIKEAPEFDQEEAASERHRQRQNKWKRKRNLSKSRI